MFPNNNNCVITEWWKMREHHEGQEEWCKKRFTIVISQFKNKKIKFSGKHTTKISTQLVG